MFEVMASSASRARSRAVSARERCTASARHALSARSNPIVVPTIPAMTEAAMTPAAMTRPRLRRTNFRSR